MRYAAVMGMALLLGACGSGSESATENSAGSATPVTGEQAFSVCANCHSRDANARKKVGPHLQGLIGRKAGSVEGFAYSPALKASEIVWDAKTLDVYLADPLKMVPGSRMSNITADPARRQALIEYLSAP